ncbi:MAG: ParA family protein [Magnetococcales bacterium]|nr:ParA family protein [Magnetococcales bacterium]
MITLVGNLKGGCGKSTIAFNLAVWLAHGGHKVVAFDLDPQATLSDASEVRREEEVSPTLRVFRPDSNPMQILKDFQEGEVLIDVGASNLWAMRQAIGMADRIVIPVPPSQADVWSTQRFLDITRETVAAKQKAKPELILFVNRADTHPGLKETSETYEVLKTIGGVRVLPCKIGQRTAYRRSFSEGRAVFELAPGSKAADEFLMLATELFPAPGMAMAG